MKKFHALSTGQQIWKSTKLLKKTNLPPIKSLYQRELGRRPRSLPVVQLAPPRRSPAKQAKWQSHTVETSAGNWAGSGRHGPSPSCFGPKGVGPRRPKKISGRAVPAQRVKIEAQPGPKARRAFFGPCRPKHGPHITKINNKTYEDTQISTIRNSHNSKYLNMKHT